MSGITKILKRINKQIQQIQNLPLENIIVAIKQTRQIHFCIYGLSQSYQNGFYHGVLQLPENYPFSAPKFKLLTNNGRFQAGKYVCTTFTNYHQQAWSSSWTIRTILTAILSFFLSNQKGYGSIQSTNSQKQYLASKSLDQNLKNPVFFELFSQKLKNKGIKHQKLYQTLKIIQQIQLKELNIITNKQIQSNYESKNNQLLIDQNFQSQTLIPQANLQGNRINQNKKFIRFLYIGLIIFILILVIMKT